MDNNSPYITKDGRAAFDSALAAAHYYEDRFLEFQANILILGVAQSARDLEGVRFALSQLQLLAQAVEGPQLDPRDFPEVKTEEPS